MRSTVSKRVFRYEMMMSIPTSVVMSRSELVTEKSSPSSAC